MGCHGLPLNYMVRFCVAAALATTVCVAQGPSLIVLENQRPGSVEWNVGRDGVGVVEGFADSTSVAPGEPIRIFVQSSVGYRFEIYRLGWYSGAGARRYHVSETFGPSPQPLCDQDPTTRMISCARWRESHAFRIPEDWLTGAYWLRFVEDGPLRRYTGTVFVVRERRPTAAIMAQLPFNTYQAYNDWGGTSLYYGPGYRFETRSYKVSFDRPYHKGRPNFMVEGYPMVRWLEKEGFSLAYSSNIDLHQRPETVASHKAWITVGHDEYWSRAMRTNVEAGRDAGVHLGFFAANEIYRQVRLEGSALGALRVVVCYVLPELDPAIAGGDVREATGAFRGAPINRPENQLVGIQYEYGYHTRPDKPSDWTPLDVDNWLFQGTGLRAGDAVKDVVGHEFDALSDNGLTPPGITVLAQSRVCNDFDVCTFTSHSTIYSADSGAFVFAAGSMQWPNSLDRFNHPCISCAPIDPRFLRLNRNLLRRFEGIDGPTGDGIVPSSGRGRDAVFTARFSHPESAGRLVEARVRVGAPEDGCVVVYRVGTGRFALSNGGGTAAPGASLALENSGCAVDVASSTVSMESRDLAINLRVRLRGGEGMKPLSLQATDMEGRTSSWDQFAEWNDSSGPLVTGVVSGSSGGFQRFSVGYSHGSGGQLARLRFKVSDSEEEAGCQVEYDAEENRLYLADEDGGRVGGAAPGESGLVESSACLLDPSQSRLVRAGRDTTLVASLWFAAELNGVRRLFSDATDRGGVSSGWRRDGPFTVTSGHLSSAVSAQVEQDGDFAVISGVYFHPEGIENVRLAYVLVNSVATGQGGCQLIWNTRDTSLLLTNDANTAIVSRDSDGLSENSQCSVSKSWTSHEKGRLGLILRTRVQLKAILPQPRRVYCQTLDFSGAGTGWAEKGVLP